MNNSLVGGTFHIIPINDLREHKESKDCWCKPKQDIEEPSLYIHNSLDKREEYENGRPLQ